MAEKVVVRGFAAFFVFTLCMNVFLTTGVVALVGNQWTGPWVNEVRFHIIRDQTEMVHSLLNGEIDIIGENIHPSFIEELQMAENVEISEMLEFAYYLVFFNCRKYPMNYTEFRRAIAFALDKNEIGQAVWEGLLQPLDCHIPRQHPASIENDMDYHYYERDMEKAVSMLESAGFIDTDNDGWREGPGPDGPGTVELSTIIIEGLPGEYIPDYVGHVVQAMLDLNISTEARISSFYEYNPRCRCGYRGDFDMLFQKYYWFDLDLDFYAIDMSTEYLNVPLYNTPNWSNSTWDSYAYTVLHSTDYDEIIEAVKEMEYIWVYACPAIIIGQSKYFTAYRTDEFEGIVEDFISGAPNFYTNIKVHHIDGESFGGVLDWGISSSINSMNHLDYNPACASYIFQLLYDSLVRIGPNGDDIDWLIEKKIIETHEDNPNVLEGHTRFTIDIIQNGSWSDGTPINATDVSFSLNYLRENVWWIYYSLKDMFSCYSTTDYRLICEFKTGSYWHWHRVAYEYVIPRQVWLDYFGAYNDYQPNSTTFSKMLTSGPFIANTWIEGDLVELVQNPYYFRNPRNIPTTDYTTTTENITSTITNGLVSRQTQGFIVGISCAVTVIIALDYIRRKRLPVGSINE